MKLPLYMIAMTVSIYALAAPDTLGIKASNAPYNQALKTMEAKAEQKQIMKQTQEAATSQKVGSSDVMIIEPSVRAQDFKEAFTYLTEYKAGSPLYFELQDKEKLYNVLDLSLMKGGTIVIFKINTTQGLKYRVVKTEDIVSMGND
jgi:hypothetical protein